VAAGKAGCVHITRNIMPAHKDHYTAEEYNQLIKTPQKQLKAVKKKQPDLTRWMCKFNGRYQPAMFGHVIGKAAAGLIGQGRFIPDVPHYNLAEHRPVSWLKPRPPDFAISLPGIGPSLNQIWSKTLSVRDLYKIKKSWRVCTHLWLKEYHKQKLDGKYLAFYVGQFGHGAKMYDSINLAPTAKIIEDTLVKKNPFDADSKALVDDNPEIIGSITCIPVQPDEDLGTWSHLYLYKIP